MNTSFFVAFAVVLLLICPVAAGADWKLYGVAGGCKYYYDASSVETLSKGIKKVWIKQQADNDKCIFDLIEIRTRLGMPITGYEDFSYAIIVYKLDCSLEKQCTETFTDYDKKGVILEIYTAGTENWYTIMPESVTYGLFEQICK